MDEFRKRYYALENQEDEDFYHVVEYTGDTGTGEEQASFRNREEAKQYLKKMEKLEEERREAILRYLSETPTENLFIALVSLQGQIDKLDQRIRGLEVTK